jgi:hypothetical protein
MNADIILYFNSILSDRVMLTIRDNYFYDICKIENVIWICILYFEFIKDALSRNWRNMFLYIHIGVIILLFKFGIDLKIFQDKFISPCLTIRFEEMMTIQLIHKIVSKCYIHTCSIIMTTTKWIQSILGKCCIHTGFILI